MGTLERLPRRRRRSGQAAADPCPAPVLAFPDRIGLVAPAFDPGNPVHVMKWEIVWRMGLMEAGRRAPAGHPLRAWYDHEMAQLLAAPPPPLS